MMPEFKNLLGGIKNLLNPVRLTELAELLANPRAFVEKRFSKKPSFKAAIVTFLFLFAVSAAVLTVVLRSQHAGVLTSGSFLLLEAIYVFVVAGTIKGAWRIAGGKATYVSTLIVSFYIVGVGLVLASVLIALVVAFVLEKSTTLFIALLTFLFFVMLWKLFSWKAFRFINGGSKVQSVTALLLTVFFNLPMAWGFWGLSRFFVRVE